MGGRRTGTPELGKLALLAAYFAFLAALFYFVRLGQLSWAILAASALAWFAIEANANRGRVGNALRIGALLLVFDFIFENSGWILGLWETRSIFAAGVVPLEVMGIALFGGAAWALYIPRRFNMAHSLADSLVFALFGALGEWLLIGQGLFSYKLWWNGAFAFAAYFLTWALLHFARYRVFRD